MQQFKNTIKVALITGFVAASLYAACDDCTEVPKEQIPAKYLAKTVMQLPSGIKIWNVDEALAALKAEDPNVLWVDTRPNSFFQMGTVANAEIMVWDQTGVAVGAKDASFALSKNRLMDAMKKKGDVSKVKVAFFCQGPKCHRSYNAALLSVREYGISPSQIVWFRDGYPLLLEKIQGDAKLARKKDKYLKNVN